MNKKWHYPTCFACHFAEIDPGYPELHSFPNGDPGYPGEPAMAICTDPIGNPLLDAMENLPREIDELLAIHGVEMESVAAVCKKFSPRIRSGVCPVCEKQFEYEVWPERLMVPNRDCQGGDDQRCCSEDCVRTVVGYMVAPVRERPCRQIEDKEISKNMKIGIDVHQKIIHKKEE